MSKSFATRLSKFKPGYVIDNKYKVISVIGYGGIGFVLKVVDKKDNFLALKILYPKYVLDEAILKRFKRELTLAQKIDSPNIVKLYNFGEIEDSYYYISMEYVDGINLGQELSRSKNKKMTYRESAEILKKISDAIYSAHKLNIIHRDLKPDNIIISKNNCIKITDFGLARTLICDENLTKTGEAVGTPHYMSPEQIRGASIDTRSDIYAIGIIGYELITGSKPFTGETWIKLATKHLTEPLPDLGKDKELYPRWYKKLLIKATNKNPSKRFKSTKDLSKYINRHLNGFWSFLSP